MDLIDAQDANVAGMARTQRWADEFEAAWLGRATRLLIEMQLQATMLGAMSGQMPGMAGGPNEQA